jgi:hypothetical protein
VINSASPGVFFYYTRFSAPITTSLEVNVVQTTDFVDFAVQNASNIRLFRDDCSSPIVLYQVSFVDGQAKVTFPNGVTAGEVYVISVKYETGSIVGQSDPGTVHYDFYTEIDGNIIDQDIDGLILRPK